MANGILVVPLEKEPIKLAESGIKCPMEIPINIARKIQSVRYLSKNPKRFLRAGVQLWALMF